ncbi:hypothetical protein LIER_02502 [Lithospermum erythrorhizon]|uniref:Protein kinase domain-containing protein n=1 Tax=Lithospermum erythrorhizon TaxID=34254 RepID=A0AAV3NPP6_LITER
MIKCFAIFKNKFKSKRDVRSAPERRNHQTSGAKRGTRSAGSISSSKSIPEMYREKHHNLRVFSPSELKEATNNFSRLLKIGEGGFGSVYKGRIRPLDGHGDPVIVAIKKLNTQGLQGHKQWVAEVQFLGVLDHPNLVKLIGYCAADGERGIQRLLVYEYMQNKSLEDHLFNRAVPTIPWKSRLQIILGAAQGMEYLHEGLEVQVIYRDFKSSNVLLDKDFHPKLSDFGLAREGPEGNLSHVSTAPVGTYGYAAPEYVETGHLSTKSDVYSFGVVLYELITGRRTIERNLPAMERKLLDWVKQFPPDGRNFSVIIDPRIRNQYSPTAARRIASLADSCLSKNANNRPTMNQVVEILQEVLQDSSQGGTSSGVRIVESSKSDDIIAAEEHLNKMGVRPNTRHIPIAQKS